MASFFNQLENFIWNIIHRPTVTDIIDILIIAIILFEIVMIVRRTRAVQVLKGVAVFIVVGYLSNLLQLKTLSWLMQTVINNGVLALVILFQPEIRKTLEQLGRGTKLDRRRVEVSENTRIVEEITRCLIKLAKRRVGALVVFEGSTGLQDVMETGTEVDSRISAALLENIFEPNTPLHDGAVIIRQDRIATAACVLTLSDSNMISSSLGTRHRAGLGITETTDATVPIVSEETGIISEAKGGKLTRYLDEAALREILRELYPENPRHSRLLALRKKGGIGGNDD